MGACSNAVQLMGPRRIVQGARVTKLFRDVKLFDMCEGTDQIQRVIISRRIFE